MIRFNLGNWARNLGIRRPLYTRVFQREISFVSAPVINVGLLKRIIGAVICWTKKSGKVRLWCMPTTIPVRIYPALCKISARAMAWIRWPWPSPWTIKTTRRPCCGVCDIAALCMGEIHWGGQWPKKINIGVANGNWTRTASATNSRDNHFTMATTILTLLKRIVPTFGRDPASGRETRTAPMSHRGVIIPLSWTTTLYPFGWRREKYTQNKRRSQCP